MRASRGQTTGGRSGSQSNVGVFFAPVAAITLRDFVHHLRIFVCGFAGRVSALDLGSVQHWRVSAKAGAAVTVGRQFAKVGSRRLDEWGAARAKDCAVKFHRAAMNAPHGVDGVDAQIPTAAVSPARPSGVTYSVHEQ